MTSIYRTMESLSIIARFAGDGFQYIDFTPNL